MKVIGYCRVSTEEQVREGVSLDNQAEKIRAYATLKDMELIEIIIDPGASGKDLTREGIQRALTMLQSGDAGALIVYKLDRLTRSTKDLLSLVYDVFIPQDIALHSLSEALDTTTANGRFFLTMLGGIATWEREAISERTKDALAHKRQNGEWVGRIPYGFTVKENHLSENPQEMTVIRKAKRLRREGKSIREISKRLGISKSVIHRYVNANARTVKTRYLNGSSKVSVP